jgi:hypothetical protein
MVTQAHDAALLQLNQVVLKACEKDASERYRTAAELLQALQALKAQLPRQ